jgi:hypothetical protein
MISENRIDSEAVSVSINNEAIIEKDQTSSQIINAKLANSNGSAKFLSDNGSKSLPAEKERSNVARIWREALKPKDRNSIESSKVVVEEPKFTEVPKSPSVEREKSNISKIWTNALKTKDGKASETVEKSAVDDAEKVLEPITGPTKENLAIPKVERTEKLTISPTPVSTDMVQVSEEQKKEPMEETNNSEVKSEKISVAEAGSMEVKSSSIPTEDDTKNESNVKSKDVPVGKPDEPLTGNTFSTTDLTSPMKVKESQNLKYVKRENDEPADNINSNSSLKTESVRNLPASSIASVSKSISSIELKSTDDGTVLPLNLSASEVKPTVTEESAPMKDGNVDSIEFPQSHHPSTKEQSESEVKLNHSNVEEADLDNVEVYCGEQLIFPESDDSPNKSPHNDRNIIVSTENAKKKVSKTPLYPRPLSPRQKKPVKSPKSVLKDDYTVKPSPPVKTASNRLLKTTAARMNDQQILETRKKDRESEIISPKKKIDNYIPSPRLLATTQARVADVKEWEAHREKAKYEQDIWWEARKPAIGAKVDPSTPSKLFESTSAYDNSKRDKHITVKNDNPPSTPPEPVKINVKSPLLKPTVAVLYSAWKVDPPKQEQQNLVLESQVTGPSVQSKFNQDTAASQHARWKSKEQKEKEEIQTRPVSPPGRKVSEVSPRLLDLNTNLKAAARSKARKTDEDPRESGWKTSYSKSDIPEVDLSVPPSRRSPIKAANRSPGGTVYSDASNRSHHSEQLVLDTANEEMDSKNTQVMQ